METINHESKGKGINFLLLSLGVFCGISLEVLYGFFLEPAIYGTQMDEWTTAQGIIHWTITCISWGLVAWMLVKRAKEKYQYDLFQKCPKIKPWQWGVTLLIIVLAWIYNYIDWKGFKVIIEFQHNGLLNFIFQYIYYLTETVMFTLIIVFGQVAFEKWFHNQKIPYGGIIAALTWGIGHWLTKGAIDAGIWSALYALGFGSIYLLLNRNIKWTYLALCLMFLF